MRDAQKIFPVFEYFFVKDIARKFAPAGDHDGVQIAGETCSLPVVAPFLARFLVRAPVLYNHFEHLP